jgi:ribosome-binding protein aMBF1 (putative translation factor)
MQKHPVRKRAILEVVADARRAAGLSQRELSERLKEANNYIQRIESGERGLQVSEFVEIARALDVDPTELLRKALRGG